MRRYTFTYHDIREKYCLTNNEYSVMDLVYQMYNSTGKFRMFQSTIAKRVGQSERSVRRIVKKLIEVNLLRENEKNNNLIPHSYWVIDMELMKNNKEIDGELMPICPQEGEQVSDKKEDNMAGDDRTTWPVKEDNMAGASYSNSKTTEDNNKIITGDKETPSPFGNSIQIIFEMEKAWKTIRPDYVEMETDKDLFRKIFQLIAKKIKAGRQNDETKKVICEDFERFVSNLPETIKNGTYGVGYIHKSFNNFYDQGKKPKQKTNGKQNLSLVEKIRQEYREKQN